MRCVVMQCNNRDVLLCSASNTVVSVLLLPAQHQSVLPAERRPPISDSGNNTEEPQR